MNGLSLFSGIGGMDLAFEWAGGHVIAMCEIEPYCQKILRKHWPDVLIFENVKELNASDVGAVDIIYGGFPCQPFSVAGKQKGKDDNRYLWPEFSRLVRDIKPNWVVAENVPGILRIAADDVCSDLERQGYSVGIWDFEAAAVGAKHRRERIFFVAHSGCSLRQRSFEQTALREETQGGIAYQSERPSETYAPDTDKVRCDMWRPERGRMERQEQTFDKTDTSCKVVADTSSSRCKRGQSCGLQTSYSPFGLCGRWEPEPKLDRMAYGISHRVDRLRALGNAVVPQQIYPIFKAIMEVENNNELKN